MSENAEALAVIREEAGAEAFRRICARLCGDRVWFPHKRRGLPISVRIVGYLRAGYDVKRIAHHLGCSVRYVRGIKRRS
jgi:AraC-like DNA-binding protein